MKQIGKKYNRHEALRLSVDPSEAQEVKEADSRGLADHHIISASRNSPISLFNFVQTNSRDLAMKVWHNLLSVYHLAHSLQGFVSKLNDHLLGQIRGLDFDGNTDQLQ